MLKKIKKRMKKSAPVLLCFVLMSAACFSQNSIVAKAFVKSGSIYLRFVPNNNSSLHLCLSKGYVIKRINWENNELPDSTKFRSASSIHYTKAINKDSQEWAVLTNKFEEAGFLYNCLYEPLNNKNANPSIAFGLAMLSCDFNVELAAATGLFFKDENVIAAKYAYSIQPADATLKKTIKPAIIIVNANRDDELKNIDSLKITTRRKEVKLFWNELELKSYYTGYFIERSEDGKTFSPLNKKPHIQVRTQYEKNKTDISYNDTITEYGKTYFYRVRGLGFFGVHGNYSNIVQCKLIKPLDDFPQADSTHLLHDTALQVNWHMPINFNLKELKGYHIYRSSDIDGTYKRINKELLFKEAKNFTDYFPNPSNYYKVVAYNNYGDSAFSHPMMGLIPDKTPPQTPIGLKGKIDTLGNVMLSWKPNHEKDLMGYRIFRNNALNEELVEITKIIFNDTVYKDSITLETVTEEVYYSITALDKVYNNSPFATPVKLKRPDKIKPVEAQFVSVIHNDTSIIVKWISSTSKDVQRYELFRKTAKTDFEKIKEWTVENKIDSMVDVKLEYANEYTYQIKVVDDDGNFAVSTSPSHYYDARVRKPIKQIKYKIDLEKKIIVLNWDYSEKDVYSFVIYKAKKEEPLKIIKTLKPNVFSFEDKDLYIGNKYVYRIKANFNSGAESFMSDEVIVDF